MLVIHNKSSEFTAIRPNEPNFVSPHPVFDARQRCRFYIQRKVEMRVETRRDINEKLAGYARHTVAFAR